MKHLGILIVLVGAAICLFFVTPILGIGMLVIVIVAILAKIIQGYKTK